MVSENRDPDWAIAIICDSDKLPHNLEPIVMAIGMQFNYLPSLTLYGEVRALFLCKTMADSITASTVASLRMGISTVFLNKYTRMVNVIDSRFSLLDGGFQTGDYILTSGTPKPLNL